MIEILSVEAIMIGGDPKLDPICVYWENSSHGQGRVTITCYGEAWTAYWGAMGENNIKQFFLRADDDYIAHRLQGAQFQKHTHGHLSYLKRIVRAVKESISETD